MVVNKAVPNHPAERNSAVAIFKLSRFHGPHPPTGAKAGPHEEDEGWADGIKGWKSEVPSLIGLRILERGAVWAPPLSPHLEVP